MSVKTISYRIRLQFEYYDDGRLIPGGYSLYIHEGDDWEKKLPIFSFPDFRYAMELWLSKNKKNL